VIASGAGVCHIRRAMRWLFVAIAYVFIGIAAYLGAWWRGVSVWAHPRPWVLLDLGVERYLYSALLGTAIAGLVVMTTRALVGRVAFATRLHSELRPLACSMTAGTVIYLALSSALGEELLFRGLLEPWIGLIPQALIFGALHQMGGSSRWVWMAWATIMGLLLGAMYQYTGSLVGPLMAHALINAINLSHLKSFDPHRAPRRLGGLLSLREGRSR
jgi:membrane protease YdiL (CAAX protease family)